MRLPAASWSTLLFLGAVLCVSGCNESPGITTQTVPKKDQTLVAYIPKDDAVWFVKMSGAVAFVGPLEEDFRKILSSLEFDDSGEPTVQLPEGWSKQAAKSMRFATYSKGGVIEVAITRLTATDPLDDTYIRLNIDRWLRELGQPPRKGGWREETEKRNELETINVAGTDAFLFDLRGNILPAKTALIISADLDYQVPDSWVEKPGDQFRLAIFEVPGGVQASLSEAGGNPVDNIQRWERQLGLEPTKAEELREKLETIEVSGQPALLIRLDGNKETPESEEPTPTSTIGVIAIDSETQYFIKMMGPTEGIDAAENDFRAFLKTIAF